MHPVRGTRPLAMLHAVALAGLLAVVLSPLPWARPVPAVAASQAPVRFGNPSASAPTGTSGAATRLVVGLGDSVPAGSACACDSFVARVATHLSSDQSPVAARNLAVPGQTTQDLLDQLDAPEVAASVHAADVVLVTIGANDFDDSVVTDPTCSTSAGLSCYQPTLRQLTDRTAELLTRLHAVAGPRTRIVVTGYWAVFLDGQVARREGADYLANSDALTRAVNGLLASSAAAHGDTYVDVYTPFKAVADDTSLLADDGDHPDAAGHELIASAVVTALES